MSEIKLDAAQRVIETDSFLMAEFMKTDKQLSMSERIEYIFVVHIKYDKRFYKPYEEIINEQTKT